LVGPAGSMKRLHWHALRSRIESDERFCRKFVWLPSSTPDREDLSLFLERTFLARPWAVAGLEPTSLDPIQQLIDDASPSSELSASEVKAWIERLGHADGSGMASLAEDLVSLLETKR
jgi:hypothetical protein